MGELIVPIIVALVASVGSVVTVLMVTSKKGSSTKIESPSQSTDVSRESIVVEAKAKAKEIELEAKDRAMKLEQEAKDRAMKIEQENQNKAAQYRNKLMEEQKSISVQKASVDAKEKQLDIQLKSVEDQKEQLAKKKEDLEVIISEEQEKLEKTAGLTREEARKELLESFEREVAKDKGRMLRRMEEEVKNEVDEKAREILVYAMKQGSTDYVVEHSSAKVKLPDEDMKGRIIGKEGRNIRKFEELTGTELDLDESPGEILISSFDPVRREVAKVALEKLLADGRIQPAKIEELVAKTQEDIDKIIYKEGDNLCHRLGVYNLPNDLVRAIGRFKYRFSYGQNMIEHSLEVSKIGMAIAAEVGANVEIVKMGCLLHDIGKVLEGEGSHIDLGVEFLKKHNMRKEVIECVAEHHEDRPFSSIESVIVHIADHVSGARPSARSEDYESYVKRLKDLEDAAISFDGVEKAYAISAGREVRVFVKPEAVDDDSTALLAREIARKIELEQTYPGTVKVTAIRETRVTETAK